MPKNVIQIELETTGDVKGVRVVSSEMDKLRDKVEKNTQKMSQDYEAAFRGIQRAAAVAFAATAGAIGFAVKQAADEEAGLRRLQTAVELTGKSWDSVKPRVMAYTAEMQALTQFADDQMAASMQTIIQLTGDVEKGFTGSKLAADMAASGLFDIDTASRYLAMAMEGNLMMLGRYIPALKESALEQAGVKTTAEKAEYAMRILGEKFGGVAQANVQSFSGQFQQMKNYMSDAAESIGYVFMPALTDVLKLVKDGAGLVKTFADENRELVLVAGNLALGITATVAGFSGLALIIPKVRAGLVLLSAAYTAVATAAQTAYIAMLYVPGWGWIAALGTAIVGLTTYYLLNAEAADDTAEATKRFAERAAYAKKQVEEFLAVLKKTPKEAEELGKQLEKPSAALEKFKYTIPPVIETYGGLLIETEALKKKTDEEVVSLSNLDEILKELSLTTIPELIAKRDQIGFLLDDSRTKALLTADAFRSLQDQYAILTTTIEGMPPPVLEFEMKPREPKIELKPISLEPITVEVKAATISAEEALEIFGDTAREELQAYQAAWMTATASITDMQMTGSERWKLIMKSFADAAIAQIARRMWQEVIAERTVQMARKEGLAVEVASSAKSIVAAGAEAIAWMKTAFAKITAFFGFLGPFAPYAALGTIAAAIAALKAIAFHKGGIASRERGGYIYGGGLREIPALLEEGEYVIRREAVPSYIELLEAINAMPERGGAVAAAPAYAMAGAGTAFARPHYGDTYNFYVGRDMDDRTVRLLREEVLPAHSKSQLRRKLARP